MSMTLVSSITVGSGGASSITFTNIPQTGKDLLAYVSVRTTEGLGYWSASITLNSQGSTLARGIQGDGSSVAAFGSNVLSVPGTNETATFGSTYVYVANYTSSSAKSLWLDNVTERNATNANQEIGSNFYGNTTSAVTSFALSGAGTLAQNSIISLYIIN